MALLASLFAVLVQVVPAHAGCGCDKPAPPLAAVRPFFGWKNSVITLFDSRLVVGQRYSVLFAPAAGTPDWSRGKAVSKRDLADGKAKTQLRVRVADVALGPCTIKVYVSNTAGLPTGNPLYTLADAQFTMTAPPVALDDDVDTVAQDGYRAGVGRDGSIYIPVDTSAVTAATSFTGAGLGFPLMFGSYSVAMYNDQGYLMQLLDPTVPGLFQISQGDALTSNALSYWRHEFATYKASHRQQDRYLADDTDPSWHADGTRHVNHDMIVVVVRGTLPDGSSPTPGATPPFKLAIVSQPSAQLAPPALPAP